MLAGAAGAIGASACCAGPLLLVVLGLGGAWGAQLAALEAYQPVFVVATLAFFGLALHRLYLRPEACAPGESCAVPTVKRRLRAIFWIVAALAIALMALPIYAPLLYRGDPMKTPAIMAALLSAAAAAPAAQPRTVTLDVANMDCAVCPITVRMALEKVPGVSSARVDFRSKVAVVAFDADKTSPAMLTRATADAGFPSSVKQVN